MKLTVSDGAAFNKFGWSMSLSQNTLVVGAYGAKIGENEEQGAGYVYYLFESGLYLPVIVR